MLMPDCKHYHDGDCVAASGCVGCDVVLMRSGCLYCVYRKLCGCLEKCELFAEIEKYELFIEIR